MIFFKDKAVLSLFLLLCIAKIAHGWGSSKVGGSSPGCEAYTKLLPRHDEYRKHCEAEAGPSGSDPKHPCFTMWYSDLYTVNATVDGTRIAPDDFFLVKDGYKTDFTIRDASQPFTMSWWGDVSMSYSEHNKETGCYKIVLAHKFQNKRRIWVSDEQGHDRDIDTLNYSQTGKVLCTKWLHIHVKEDGHDDD